MRRDRAKAVRWTLGVSFAVALNLALLVALSGKNSTRLVEVSHLDQPRNISIEMVHDRAQASTPPSRSRRSEPTAFVEPTSAPVPRSDSRHAQPSNKPSVIARSPSAPGQARGRAPAPSSAPASGEPRPDLSGVLRSLNACKDFRRNRDVGDAQCPIEDAAAPDVAPLDPTRKSEFDAAQARSADQLKVSDDLRRGLAGHNRGSIVQFGCRMKGGSWKCGLF